MRGESGRNELLRGPFALFGVRGSAKLVRNLAKHRRTPMSPPQLIPPTSPGQVSDGDGRLRRRFSHTGHGPFRALIVSNLKWGGPCRSPRPRQSSPGTKDSYTHPTTPSAGLRPLNVSRVKCGGGPCRGHSVLPCAGINLDNPDDKMISAFANYAVQTENWQQNALQTFRGRADQRCRANLSRPHHTGGRSRSSETAGPIWN